MDWRFDKRATFWRNPRALYGMVGYRSGQTGLTVNQLATPSQVRVLLLPPFFKIAGFLMKAGFLVINFIKILSFMSLIWSIGRFILMILLRRLLR